MELKYRNREKAIGALCWFLFIWVSPACRSGGASSPPQPSAVSQPQKNQGGTIQVLTPIVEESSGGQQGGQGTFSPPPPETMEPAAVGNSEKMAESLEQTTLGLAQKQMEMAQNLFTVTMPKYQEPGGSSQPYPVRLEQPNPGQRSTEEPQPMAVAPANQTPPEEPGQVSKPNPTNQGRPEDAGQPSVPNPKVVVAVFDVQDASKKNRVDQDTLDQLTEYLAAQLTEQAGFRVVPRDQLRDRLAEQRNESYKKCFDESCQIELGKAVAAQKSLATKLLRVGKTCAITAILYDLKTETTEKATSADTDCNEDSLMEGVRNIALKLSGKDVNSR